MPAASSERDLPDGCIATLSSQLQNGVPSLHFFAVGAEIGLAGEREEDGRTDDGGEPETVLLM